MHKVIYIFAHKQSKESSPVLYLSAALIPFLKQDRNMKLRARKLFYFSMKGSPIVSTSVVTIITIDRVTITNHVFSKLLIVQLSKHFLPSEYMT